MYESEILSHGRWLGGWPDGVRADFSGLDLTGIDFKGVNLAGADFSGADMTSADLRGTRLRGADFTGATLAGANLTNATIQEADFSGADLRGATIDYSILQISCVITDVKFDDDTVTWLLQSVATVDVTDNAGKIKGIITAIRNALD